MFAARPEKTNNASMYIRADFSQAVAVTPQTHDWVPSPLPGVCRMMLDRVGGEHARATSLVRYAPGSGYSAHSHPGGEEILVLSGTFSEGPEHYPAGWYLRNPPGSHHEPYSAEGALIFVKLWQMPADETETVRIDTGVASHWHREGHRAVCPLFARGTERVSLQRLAPGEAVLDQHVDGAELLVVSGELVDGTTRLGPLGWLRLPPGLHTDVAAGPRGATVYLKTKHLPGLEIEA